MIFEWLKEIGVKAEYDKKRGIIDVEGSCRQIKHISERLDSNGYVNDALALAQMFNPNAKITGKYEHMYIYHNEADPDSKGYMLLGF